MKTFCIMLLAFIIGLGACKKINKNKMPLTNTTALSEVLMDSVAPSNPGSIYNSIGWKHNRIVDYLQDHYTGQDFKKLIDCLRPFYEEEMGRSMPEAQLLNNLERMKPTLVNPDSFMKAMIHSTPLLKSYERFKAGVDKLYDNGHSYKELREYMMQYEIRVAGEYALSKEERTLLLQTIAVARYSIYYWMHTSKPVPGANCKGIFSKEFWIDVGVFLMTLGDTYTSGMYSSSFG